jgi:hypothetical protein
MSGVEGGDVSSGSTEILLISASCVYTDTYSPNSGRSDAFRVFDVLCFELDVTSGEMEGTDDADDDDDGVVAILLFNLRIALLISIVSVIFFESKKSNSGYNGFTEKEKTSSLTIL